MHKGKISGNISAWKTVIIGALTALLIVLIMCAVFAKLLIMETIPEAYIEHIIWGMLMVSASVGATIVKRKAKAKTIMMIIGAEVLYMLLLLLINMLVFRKGICGMFANLTMILGGAALSMIPRGRGKGRGGTMQRRGSIVKLNKKHRR